MPETTTANNKFKLEMTIPGVDERHLPTDTFLLVSVALMAIYFVVVVYYIVPKFQQTLTSYRDLQAKSKELEHYQERQEDIERILHDERYNDSMVSLVDRILYNYNPYTEVLLSIDQLAQKHRLTVSGLEYSPGLVATPSAQVASSEESYPITFNVSGSYREITAFLLNLEKQAPFNSVSSARITNNYNDGSATAQVEVLAQYHLPKVLVSVETDLSPIGADEEKTLATLQEFQLNDYNLGHPTITQEKQKIDLFALEDYGLVFNEDENQLSELIYDPNTGEWIYYNPAANIDSGTDFYYQLDTQYNQSHTTPAPETAPATTTPSDNSQS